jgi:hypothetical protein
MTKKYLTACILLLMGICWGCGAGEYERRMEARVVELKSEAKFNILGTSMDVPDTFLSIRIPKEVKDPPITEETKVEDKPIDPRRVKTNVIDIPGFKETFEGLMEDASKGKQPFYLYVGATTDPHKKIADKLIGELKGKSKTPVELTDYPVQAPDGKTVTWKKCRATGSQEFYYITPEGLPQFRLMQGTIILLFYQEEDTLVTLAWRMPVGIEQSLDLDTWMNRTAGCVKVTPQ